MELNWVRKGKKTAGGLRDVERNGVHYLTFPLLEEQGGIVSHGFATRIGGVSQGKFLLDLWRCNEIILREAGVLPEHIQVTDICTRCNPDYLFSHRFAGEERGNLAAFLCLRG